MKSSDGLDGRRGSGWKELKLSHHVTSVSVFRMLSPVRETRDRAEWRDLHPPRFFSYPQRWNISRSRDRILIGASSLFFLLPSSTHRRKKQNVIVYESNLYRFFHSNLQGGTCWLSPHLNTFKATKCQNSEGRIIIVFSSIRKTGFIMLLLWLSAHSDQRWPGQSPLWYK